MSSAAAAGPWRLALETRDLDVLAAAVAAFETECPSVSAFESTGGWRVEGLGRDKPNLALIEAALALACESKPASVTLERLPARDWVVENQAGFPPLPVGRFFIHGSHFAGQVPRAAIPILIDAATAFGTGEHATTRGCLIALEKVARHLCPSPLEGEGRNGAQGAAFRVGGANGAIPPTRSQPTATRDLPLKGGGSTRLRILDMGCGTGILAIAAAKLWHRSVLACDIDPESVRVTRVNAERNQVASLIRAERSIGYRHREIARRAPFDLVLSNILARPLMRMAGDLARVLAPGGVAILSGLLARQEQGVLSAHRAQGLFLRHRIAIEGWHTLVLARR